MDTIRVPAKRIAVYRANNGAVLKKIAQKAEITAVLTPEGSIEIEGDGGACWSAGMVINAINLGFEPVKAFKLFNDDYYLEVLDLDVYFDRSEKLIARYLSRVIGIEGKAKKVIEDLSDAYLSVWEHKIGIIGQYQELADAREAVKRLLAGSTHAGVYAYLEKNKKLRRLPR